MTDHRVGLTLTGIAAVMDGTSLPKFTRQLKANYDQSIIDDLLDG